MLLKGGPGHPDTEARTSYVISTLNDDFKLKTDKLHLDTAMAKDKVDAWFSGPNADKIEIVIANNDATQQFPLNNEFPVIAGSAEHRIISQVVNFQLFFTTNLSKKLI
ncbi:hypothetical protein [Parendozoicomonas callyspongiae]|uniref:hypothetical protein n=1 Tax=Parendozoicomonas callyspongiae TaxID=2942213 RepID=UPI0038CD5C29